MIRRNKVVSVFLALLFVTVTAFIIRLHFSEKKATELLALYRSEKKVSGGLRKQAIPSLLSQTRAALNRFLFQKSELLLYKADRLGLNDSYINRLKFELYFYNQKFKAANKFISENQELTNHPLAQLAKEYSVLKSDSERLPIGLLIGLIKRVKEYHYRRLILGNERKNNSNISEYMKAVRALFEVLNPKQKELNFTFSQKNGKNSLDLSGNSRLNEIHLSSIQRLPLHNINLDGLQISDHNARKLATMPLEELSMAGTRPTDLSFISDLPNLKKVTLPKEFYSNYEIDQLRKRMTVILK